MNGKSLFMLPLFFMAVYVLSGCEAIGGIFKAGVWTGTIMVVVILAIVIFIIAKLFSKNKNA
jgi:hypothetical protein